MLKEMPNDTQLLLSPIIQHFQLYYLPLARAPNKQRNAIAHGVRLYSFRACQQVRAPASLKYTSHGARYQTRTVRWQRILCAPDSPVAETGFQWHRLSQYGLGPET